MHCHSRLFSAAVAALMLFGCTTMITRPNITSAERANGDYTSARTYLYQARTTLENKRSQSEQLNSVTKIGTGVGVVGAGVTAAFRGSVDLMLGFLTGGGVSYATNQAVDPKTQTEIYSAGIANLTCVDNAAAIAQSAVSALGTPDELRELRNRLDIQSSALKADIVALGRPVTDTETEDAKTLITAAKSLIHGIDGVTQPPIGILMVNDVDRTIDAVNEQLATKAPNIDVIRQVGSTLGTFTAYAAGMKAQAEAARKQVDAANVPRITTEGRRTSVEQQMARDKQALRNTIAATPTTLPAPNLKVLEQCRLQMPSDAPLGLEPDGPITLRAGGTASILLSQEDIYRVDWVGDVPSDVDTSVGPDNVRFTSHADAKKHDYTFRIRGRAGRSSAAQSLKVEAKALATATPKPKRRAQRKSSPVVGSRQNNGVGADIGPAGSPDPRPMLDSPAHATGTPSAAKAAPPTTP